MKKTWKPGQWAKYFDNPEQPPFKVLEVRKGERGTELLLEGEVHWELARMYKRVEAPNP